MGSFWNVIVVVVVLLLVPLVNFIKSRHQGLYQGEPDEGLLAYFEHGKAYSVLEVIKLIDDETDGEIRLSRRAAEEWLKRRTLAGRLTKSLERRKTKRGSYMTEVYTLS